MFAMIVRDLLDNLKAKVVPIWLMNQDNWRHVEIVVRERQAVHISHFETDRAGAEVVELLQEFPNVILWVAGHTHRNQISFHGSGPGHGFWHIRTSSLIDWPQQSRVIEVLEHDDELHIATYVFDHHGVAQPDIADLTAVTTLAGISRWLAANNWQRQEGDHPLDKLEGKRDDRNVVLHLAKRPIARLHA